MTRRIVLCALIALTAAGTAFARQPLKLEDVLTLRRLAWHAPLVVSADGKQVAYVLSRPTDDIVPETVRYTETGVSPSYRSADTLVTDIASGKTRNLTEGKGGSWGAKWSPDGTLLAFCSDRDGRAGLWIWNRATDTLRKVGDLVPRSPTLEWSPDGKHILMGVLPEGASVFSGVSSGNDLVAQRAAAANGPKSAVQIFKSEKNAAGGVGTQNIGVAEHGVDLSLIDVASGAVDRLIRGVVLRKAIFSPDAKHIALVEMTGDNVRSTHILYYTMKVLTLADRRLTTVVPPDEIGRWGGDISWSPDSTTLAYRLKHEAGEVRLVSITGESRPAVKSGQQPFKGMPSWDSAGRNLITLTDDAVWTISVPDGVARSIAKFPGKKVEMLVPTSTWGDELWLRDKGRSVVVVLSKGIDRELHSVALDGSGTRLLLREQKHISGLSSFNLLAAPATGEIVFASEDAQHPEDVWTTRGKLRGVRRVTNFNPGISVVPMGALRLLEWQGKDGKTYDGALVLPSDYEPGKRYPLLVYVYPVPVAPDANRFGSNILSNEHFNLQMWATRGYAALYSSAALRSADGEPMKAVAAAVMPGIDHVISLGVADPDRIGVFGASAGGYSTLALIAQSTRFKAAVAQCGVGNLISLYGDLRDTGYSHGLALNENTFQMPLPWQDRDRYLRNSPWFFLDKVETPLFLIHGTDDTASIVNQSNEMFLGLRRLGKTAQYARYRGEGHGITSLQNRLDAGQRVIEWFERYLQPEPAGSDREPSRAVSQVLLGTPQLLQ